MFSFSSSQEFRSIISKVFLLGFILSLPQASEAQQIIKSNNAIALDQGGSWWGGAVPNNTNIIVYNNSNTASTTGTIGTGLSVAGILFSTNPSTSISISNAVGGTGVLGLGASGIDIRASTNRTLTVSAPILLNADQNWYTGLTNANTAMINASGVISGAGKLTIGGAVNSSNQFVFLSGANTFSGGLVLNAGGAVRGSSTSATVSGSSVTACSLGVGPLTINGGTIFGNSGAVGFTTITINGDFSVNKADRTSGGSSANARLRIGGGFDLGSQTRTISVGSYSNSIAGILVGGNESLSFLPLSTTAGPSNTVANGVIRLVRDQSGIDGTDYSNVNFGAGGMIFASGSGMTLGKGIVTSLSTGNPFGTTAFNQPVFTVESGGIFNLSDSGNARSPIIRALSGSGVVTALGSNATAGTVSTLTVNPQTGDSYEFSGSISDGASTGLVPTANMKIGLTKSSAGLQILSGSNNMSGLITNSAGELRFKKRLSLYAGNTNLWTNLSVASGATLGLSLGGTEGFVSSDLDLLAANINIMKAGSKLGLDVASENGPVTLSTVLSNSANPNGITFSKSGNGQLNLSGYTGAYTNPVTIIGGTLKFTQLSTYSGSPAITGGGVLDLNGASFPIPATLALTDGSIVNFTPPNPFAPTSNVSYTGFSFAVNDLNNGTNGTPTFNLTNSFITVLGSLATNGLSVSGTSGVIRFAGNTTNPTALSSSNTPITSGLIQVQNGATLEFALNSSFNSYRAITAGSSNNPTILISGGTLSGIDYLSVGGGTNNTGTLRITAGSVTLATNSANGIFMGQSTGTGSFIMEGGNFTGNNANGVFKVANGMANVTISNGIVSNPSPTVWGVSGAGGGVVNFTMTGGQFAGTNAKFNFGQYTTNASFTQSGGVMDLKSSEAWLGTYSQSGGTNRANFMTIGMSNNTATYTVSSSGVLSMVDPSGNVSLLRLGDAGSTGNLIQNGGTVLVGTNNKKDITLGYGAGGTGRYELNGGTLELTGEILMGTSSPAGGTLVLNGGTLKSSAGVTRGSFIASNVVTQVGANGAVIEVANAGVTNTIQAVLNNMSGQVGKLVKRGAGTLAIGRGNLRYSGSTKVEGGTLSVTDTDAGYVARITSDQVFMVFASVPVGPTSTFKILPSSLEDGSTSISADGLAANQQISFDPSTSIATVVTVAGPTDPYELWAQGSPLTSETLLLYALGGASSPSANDGQPTIVRRSGNDLVLSVVVRANDSALKYQPQISDDLTPNSWSNVDAPYTVPVSQGVPENFERRDYSVPATNPRLFLRIQVTK